MKKFDPKAHYIVGTEETYRVTEERLNVTVKLKEEGQRLIAQYYNEKYKANIHVAVGKTPGELRKFIRDLTKETKEDCRIGICVSKFVEGPTSHSFPMVYIREGGEEGLLVSDSLGSGKEVAQLLSALTGIHVYINLDKRQADLLSCHTDAIKYCAMGAGKDPEKKTYLIPNILQQLKVGEINEGTYSTIKQPKEFLTLYQRSKAMALHEDKSDRLIQTGEKKRTLPQQRESYTRALTKESTFKISAAHSEDTDFVPPDTINVYLRSKGLKFADLIEIQFYVNQLKEELKEFFPEKAQKIFIKEAKRFLHSQRDLATREGLHTFAEDFLVTMKKGIEAVKNLKAI